MVNRSIREVYKNPLEEVSTPAWEVIIVSVFRKRGSDLVDWSRSAFPRRGSIPTPKCGIWIAVLLLLLLTMMYLILSFWLWKAQVHQFGIQPVAEADFAWLARGTQGDHPVPNPEGCLSHHLRKWMVTVVGDQRETTSQIKAAQRYPLSSSFPCYLSCGAVRSMITKA